MAGLAPRSLTSLGYPLLSADPADRELVDQLVVVLDSWTTSIRSPDGTVAHLGLHVAIHPAQPDIYYSVIVGRAQLSAQTWTQIEPHARVLDAVERINDVACVYDPGGAFYERPNALDATMDTWARALDGHPHNPRGWDTDARALDDRLSASTDRFLAIYARYGGWRYYGRPDATDPAGFAGPLFWQEEDVRFRVAYELEREFPAAVHLNSLLSPATVPDWQPDIDGKHQYADILIDDLRDFLPGRDALERFAQRPATLLVEIKFIRRRRQSRDVPRDLAGVFSDAMRLGRHLREGRTKQALMVVVDDDGHFRAAREVMPWPAGVRLLHAAPPQPQTDLPRPWGSRDLDIQDISPKWSSQPWSPPPGYVTDSHPTALTESPEETPLLEYEGHVPLPPGYRPRVVEWKREP